MVEKKFDYVWCLSAMALKSAGYEGSVLCKSSECEYCFKNDAFCTNQGKIPVSEFEDDDKNGERREINKLEGELKTTFFGSILD